MYDQHSEFLYTQSIIAESMSQELQDENGRLKTYIKSLEVQLLDTMSTLISVYTNKYP